MSLSLKGPRINRLPRRVRDERTRIRRRLLYTCSYVLHRTALACGSSSLRVCHEVCDHFFVDNWLVSYATEVEPFESAVVMYEAFLTSCFKLTQWTSSSALVRQSLPDPVDKIIDLDLNRTLIERTITFIGT